jgi:tetratricopeptide (TPR) repeat protein
LARIPDLDTATVIEPDQDRPRDRIVAYRDYLTAEAARQTGDKDRARRLWEELAKGRDQKYQARARLSLAVLDYEDGKIKPEQTIDQLEGLRYAWRGDELEMAVGARLGEIYLARGDYLRGLQVMRDAATLSPETDMGKRITATMTEAFRTLFTPAKMASVDPLDAITVFEKFTELAPSGDDANRLTLNLVDRLMQVDLLDRATKVMQDLVDYKLQDSQRVEVALRLAAVHLMNGRPDLSLAVLNRAEGMIAALPDLERAATLKAEQDMLRARALFQSDRTDQALAVLANMPEQAGALRVAADIAWQSGRWNDAARALEALMAMDPVAANKPPTPEQAELIRNLAVATNLSGDRARLAQLRAQYNLLMMQSDLATEFDIVTRERQTPTLADRDTLNKLVSEVDMFGSFLKTYRGQGGDAPAAGVNPASAPPSASPTNTPPPAQAEAEEAAPDVAAAPPAQAAAE